MAINKTVRAAFGKPGHRSARTVVLALMMMIPGGCADTGIHPALAPAPPQIDLSAPRDPITTIAIETDIATVIQPAVTARTGEFALAEQSALGLMRTQETNTRCGVKSRFDRQALLAYEWGGRNRLGLRLSMNGPRLSDFSAPEFKRVKLEYKLRFSKEKDKKAHCRYDSPWQGLLGSAYNEFFIREDDVVWHEIDDILDGRFEDGLEMLLED